MTAEIQQGKAIERAIRSLGHSQTVLYGNNPSYQSRLKMLIEKMEELSLLNQDTFKRESFFLAGVTLISFFAKGVSAAIPTPPAPVANAAPPLNNLINNPLGPDPHDVAEVGLQDFVAYVGNKFNDPHFVATAKTTGDAASDVFKTFGTIGSNISKSKQTDVETRRNIVNNLYQSTSGTEQTIQQSGRELNTAGNQIIALLQKGG